MPQPQQMLKQQASVRGSADLLQTLFKNDLVDAMELMIIPLTLGTGKRLFRRRHPSPFYMLDLRFVGGDHS